MVTVYDAARCPFCARARIALAEKGVDYDAVLIDLDDRPRWIYDKNPLGKVPVLEDGDLLLPESEVIMEYLEERYPDPPLLPDDPGERGHVRLAIQHFDHRLGSDYYAVRRGEEGARPRLADRLAALDASLAGREYLVGDAYSLADIAYVPWLLRARTLLGVDLSVYPELEAWVERLLERPAVAAELGVIAALPR